MWVGSNVKKVKKQPIILIFAGLALTAILFFFGRTTEPKKIMAAPKMTQNAQSFNIQSFIDSSKIRLTPEQALYVSKLENGINRGDVPAQQIKAFTSLANFWKDSLKSFEPYAQYIYEAAKLDNSEKNLTFAAQLFLDALRGEHDEAKLNWETITAIELFEKAIQLNPENQDLKIGLGSCYIFGKDEVSYLTDLGNLQSSNWNLVSYAGFDGRFPIFLKIIYSPALIFSWLGLDNLLSLRVNAILFYIISGLIIWRIQSRLNLSIGFRKFLITMYLFFPSVFIWTSLGFRESWIILGISLIVLAMVLSSFCSAMGFSRKSTAPMRVASTAVSMVP